MKKILFSISIAATVFALSSYSSGPAASGEAATGAPGEGNCTGCHTSNAVNSGAGSIGINFNSGTNTYTPSQTYNITVTGTGSGAGKYGFQMVALKTSDNTSVGTFTAATGSKKSTVGNRNYIEHSARSTTGVWTFQWTAPNSDVGEIKFYVAGNSCENPSSSSGDNIYTNQISITPVNVGVTENNIENATRISVFPNPSSNNFTLKFNLTNAGVTTIQLYNVEGKIVKEIAQNQLFSAGENQLSIPTNDLQNGEYFVRIINSNEILNAKLLVIH